jgi:hypothetical protein
MQEKLDLHHVHADEIRGKGWTMIAWIGLALIGSTRLWVGGMVRLRRDRRLAETLLTMVNACCQPLVAVVVLTDGWAASPGCIRRAFREKVKGVAGRGRSRLHAWPEIVRGTVITQTATQRVVSVTGTPRHTILPSCGHLTDEVPLRGVRVGREKRLSSWIFTRSFILPSFPCTWGCSNRERSGKSQTADRPERAPFLQERASTDSLCSHACAPEPGSQKKGCTPAQSC